MTNFIKLKKIALGLNIQPGPFGGGNQFARELSAYLQSKNIQITNSLADPDIDSILLTSLKPWTKSGHLSLAAARRYQLKHPQTSIILRVNECDERKKQKPFLNHLIRQAIPCVDHTVFVSQWLHQHITEKNPRLLKLSSAIPNGVNTNIFNPSNSSAWDKKSPLKLVTHHWSANWHKGWDIYSYLDQLLSGALKNKIEFTFIGNLPKNLNLKNTHHIKPLAGLALAQQLKQHHVYITASLFEPGPMHVLEAIACGLPVLYRPSGSLTEYIGSAGLAFSSKADFLPALKKITAEYTSWQKNAAAHSASSNDTAQAYLDLLANLTPRSHKPGYLSLLPLTAIIFLRDYLAAQKT